MTAELDVSGVTKAFFGVPVLKGVDLRVPAGRIVGLVGENGAGKSTLMNIVAGHLSADAGEMRLRGQPWHPHTPRAARLAGVGFVQQELNFFPNLSLAENLCLDDFPCRGPFIHRAALHRRAEALLERAGIQRPPRTLAADLSMGERQLLEVARALAANPRVLILDEPTTSLGAAENNRLFTLLDSLRRDGRALIYISHALNDVRRLCDEIVVLRDGAVVAAGPASDFDNERLVALMAGRELDRLFPERRPRPTAAPGSPALLEVDGLTRDPVVSQIHFKLHAGEILGLSGLMGAGRTELARLIFGLDAADGGTVRLDGEPLVGGPRDRLAKGLAFLTESRRDDGLCLDATVADNITLAAAPRHTRSPIRLLARRQLEAAVARLRETVRLQPRLRDGQPARTLSGGNQQKLVLAKWLMTNPRVFILDEPTRGIDASAKHDVYQLIHRLADAGAGVLVISSELEELLGLCDRILVMSRGLITGDFARSDASPEELLTAAFVGHATPRQPSPATPPAA